MSERYRVYTPDGALHLIRRADAVTVAREFPDALRWERADVEQPPQIIRDVSDE